MQRSRSSLGSFHAAVCTDVLVLTGNASTVALVKVAWYLSPRCDVAASEVVVESWDPP